LALLRAMGIVATVDIAPAVEISPPLIGAWT
jgi:hypothetical protein